MIDENDPFFMAGKYRALGVAIEALVASEPDKERHLTTALNAIEAEIVSELYKRSRPSSWIYGLQAAKDEVEAALRQAAE
jgi:hypothetical protein